MDKLLLRKNRFVEICPNRTLSTLLEALHSLIRTSPPVFHLNDIKGDAQGSESGRVAPLTSSPFLSVHPFLPEPIFTLPLPPLPILGVGPRFKTRITYTKGRSNLPSGIISWTA